MMTLPEISMGSATANRLSADSLCRERNKRSLLHSIRRFESWTYRND